MIDPTSFHFDQLFFSATMAYMTVGRNHTKPFRMNLNGKRVSEPKASRKGVAASYHSLKDLGMFELHRKFIF